MAVADKKGLQVAGNRGRRQGGKRWATAPTGNPLPTTPQLKAEADKKGGRAKRVPTDLPQRGGEWQHPQTKSAGADRNGRRGVAPSLARSPATNPRRGPNADVGRDGGSVAPPMVEPLEQIKATAGATDNARNSDEIERQRGLHQTGDGGAERVAQGN